MLSTLFPRASKKCLELPLFGPVMEGFEHWLAQQCYARLHIRALLRVVGKVDRYLRRRGIQRIEDITHLALHHYWRTLRRRAPWEAGAVHIVERFLRMRGALTSCPVTTPSALQVAEYSEYLREVRGLTPATIDEQIRVVERFLAHIDFDKTANRFGGISAADIEGFVRKLSKSLSSATLRAKVIVLRNFLRFLAANGRVRPDLAEQIDRPRVYKLEKLPRTLRWKTVPCGPWCFGEMPSFRKRIPTMCQSAVLLRGLIGACIVRKTSR
ncbi:MAG: site-specific integrase [Blastocatellia bacterium]